MSISRFQRCLEYRIFCFAAICRRQSPYCEGKIERIVVQATEKLPLQSGARKAAKRETSFLAKKKERMRYARFRAMGSFVGSGVTEPGCKNIVGHRLKQSGMRWSLRGANAIPYLDV
jgi:hypothetical protein